MKKLFTILLSLMAVVASAQHGNFTDIRLINGDSTISGTADGTIFYNRVSNHFRFRQNGSWVSLGSGSGGVTNPFADNTDLFKNSSDNSKIIRFSLAGLTTSTTRTWTFPDVSGTFARNDAAQTFTGIQTFLSTISGNISGSAATLTTPRTINGTSFDGSANITVTAAAGTLTGSTLNAGVTASSLTSVGTIATGTWNGTVVGPTYGGTGVNNGSNTLTLGGNTTFSGANAVTLTSTGSTNVTLPTSGTLASLSASNVFSGSNSFGTSGYIFESLNGSSGSAGAQFAIASSRGTYASPTVSITGDILGHIDFDGYDGSGYVTGARINAQSTGTISSGNVPTVLKFQTMSASTLTTALTITEAQVIKLNNSSTAGQDWTASGSDGSGGWSSLNILDIASASTAGSTITFDMNSQKQRAHNGSASFSAAKTLALSNSSNALFFEFTLNITSVAAVLTLPSSWAMSDPGYASHAWTPPTTGVFEFAGKWDSVLSLWIVKVSGPFIN